MQYKESDTDEALVKGCLQQHRLAQKYLYQRYYGKLLGIPMRYTGNRQEATEVLNTAFLKIFDSLPSYRGTGSLAGWMARVVFHTTIDHLRSKTTYNRVMRFDMPDNTQVDNEAMSILQTEELFALIQKLPEAYRSVFCLYVIDGYKHQEIADLLGIDEGTSKWRLNHARRELQNLLSAYGTTSRSSV